MKTRHYSVLPALIAGLGLIPIGRATAQLLTGGGNSDGAYPNAGLILSGNTLYGTASQGGSYGWGTVFAVNTDGTGFTNLHRFTGGSDGAYPYAGLTNSGNALYGTASAGGAGYGTVFKVNTDAAGFTTLHSFTAASTNSSGAYTNSGGADPQAGLILSGNTLYGTARLGGSSGAGTVFAVNTAGTGFTTLYSFTAASTNSSGAYTNSDGAFPLAGLILSGDTLYGTAAGGGSSGNGTVFSVNTDGTGFTNLHSFNFSDGSGPAARLILSGSTLYGTASAGGSASNGTVFSVNTDGAGFTNLHSFTALNNNTNNDGANSFAGLILSGNILYGTAIDGGSSGHGTVFAVNTSGTGFTNLHSFSALGLSCALGNCFYPNYDGANPYAGLNLSGNTLYGTARSGGSWGHGTVFALNTDGTGFTNLHSFTTLSLILPQLTINVTGTNVFLMWPTGFDTLQYTYRLQSTTNLVSPVVWFPVFPDPVVVNGQNIVPNPISGTQQFYRLIQQNRSVSGGCTSDTDCPLGYTCIGGSCHNRQ